ncbi:MAG: HAMP domain-containing histidine kinase [Chitinophagaceae bacterium]|nr:HAMP domain-containing histidine kinase [Chitinophagaceae bacterium]
MTLKLRISLFISLLFTLLFGVASSIIIIFFSDFRKDEFRQRLEEKALTTIKLLIEVREVDNQMLKIIDQNSINKLYDEKTLVFNSEYELIYSSLDDTRIRWTKSDLEYLKKHKTFFKKDGENEIYGVFYDSRDNDFFALISANDNYGKSKLDFLMVLLLVTYVVFTIAAWLLTFYVVKRQIAPLDYFHRNINSINEHNLDTRLQIREDSRHEIDLIGREFNFMMSRIEQAYRKQKEFTAHASHELRTPLARMSVQLENLQLSADAPIRAAIGRVEQNIVQLNELIDSLLLLSRVDNTINPVLETSRVDEALYNSIDKVCSLFPDFKVGLEIEAPEGMADLLTQPCNQHLLEIAFGNLLKNACLYSGDRQARVRLLQQDGHLAVSISNSGTALSESEQQNMFEPFSRGQNAGSKPGLGLGLRIVYRILSLHGFTIRYHANPGGHEFVINF